MPCSDPPKQNASPDPAATRLCKCGRGPWRPGQRNCLICNREANNRYRKSLQAPIHGLTGKRY
jgi:hypothetical protein